MTCEIGGPAALEPVPTDLGQCVIELQDEIQRTDRCDHTRAPACGYESESLCPPRDHHRLDGCLGPGWLGPVQTLQQYRARRAVQFS
jgi:hypothetical protein